jgi:hypothetical protein
MDQTGRPLILEQQGHNSAASSPLAPSHIAPPDELLEGDESMICLFSIAIILPP